ncbi:hypothetical protein ACFOEE_18750 [Pseudoalteromonas fenneropenaei]|uniref:Lipoprotein n=1 Tax=Pseudoalteromonas fenneropenaei TaxID=1737459 RepID=A0ABV7CPU3_9GAMM
MNYKLIISTLALLTMSGCELTTTQPDSSSGLALHNLSCEGSYQCHVVELPIFPGCATPAGYVLFSSQHNDPDRAKAAILAEHSKSSANESTCPSVYPVQALCIAQRCEAISLTK